MVYKPSHFAELTNWESSAQSGSLGASDFTALQFNQVDSDLEITAFGQDLGLFVF
jgi:hypothetical protein